MARTWLTVGLAWILTAAVFTVPAVLAQETPATSEPAPATSAPPTTSNPPPATSPPPSPCPSGAYWDPGMQQCRTDSPPPPQSCPSGQFYDYGRQMCVSQSAPPPSNGPGCPAGSYWDYQRQMCTSGSPPPPPPQCQQGQYWDQQRQMCIAGGDYPTPAQSCQPDQYWDYERKTCMTGGPHPSGGAYPSGQPQPYQDPCAEKFRTTGAQMDAVHQETEARMRGFNDEFSKARMEFSQGQHTSEEWRSFNEAWMSKGRALGESLKAEMEPKIREILGDCFSRFQSAGFPMPPMFGPEPMYGTGPQPGMDYAHMPPPPGAADGRFQLNQEGEKIRAECEAKVRAIMPTMGPRPSDGMTRPSSPPPRDPAIEAQVKEIMQECEQRIRATFQGQQGEKDGDFRDQHFGSLSMYFDDGAGKIIVQGKFLALEGNPEAQMMEKLTCGGALFIDRLFVNGLLDDFRPEESGEGSALRVYDAGKNRVLDLHDNPRCVVNLVASGEIPSITLDLADHLDVTRNAAGDLQFTDGSVKGFVLLHGAEAELASGNQIVITGRATFIVESARADSTLGSNYERAIGQKRVGAEIRVAADGAGVAVDSTPMGDLEINVTGVKDKITAVIDSAGGTGKTVVLELDAKLFGSDKVKVHVVGVGADGAETALDVREADDMTDILDPSDDGADAVEYWIIQDKNGFHVLVSFPHFSEKRVTIESADVEVAGAFLPGFDMALLLLGVVGAVGLVAVRIRRQP